MPFTVVTLIIDDAPASTPLSLPSLISFPFNKFSFDLSALLLSKSSSVFDDSSAKSCIDSAISFDLIDIDGRSDGVGGGISSKQTSPSAPVRVLLTSSCCCCCCSMMSIVNSKVIFRSSLRLATVCFVVSCVCFRSRSENRKR